MKAVCRAHTTPTACMTPSTSISFRVSSSLLANALKHQHPSIFTRESHHVEDFSEFLAHTIPCAPLPASVPARSSRRDRGSSAPALEAEQISQPRRGASFQAMRLQLSPSRPRLGQCFQPSTSHTTNPCNSPAQNKPKSLMSKQT